MAATEIERGEVDKLPHVPGVDAAKLSLTAPKCMETQEKGEIPRCRPGSALPDHPGNIDGRGDGDGDQGGGTGLGGRRTASALRRQSLLLPPVCDRLDGRVSVRDTNVAVELQI